MNYWIPLTNTQLEKFGFSKHPEVDKYNIFGINYQLNGQYQYDICSFIGTMNEGSYTVIYFWRIDIFYLEEGENVFDKKCIGELELQPAELLELVELLKINSPSTFMYPVDGEENSFLKLTSKRELMENKVNLIIQEQYKIKPSFHKQKRIALDRYSLLRTCYEYGISIILHEISIQDLNKKTFDLDDDTIGRIVLNEKEFKEFIQILHNFYLTVQTDSIPN